jgi:hypothetical protein
MGTRVKRTVRYWHRYRYRYWCVHTLAGDEPIQPINFMRFIIFMKFTYILAIRIIASRLSAANNGYW